MNWLRAFRLRVRMKETKRIKKPIRLTRVWEKENRKKSLKVLARGGGIQKLLAIT